MIIHLRTLSPHLFAVLCILVVATLVNTIPHILSGVSPAYRQSSDATVHMVQWQEFSESYQGHFDTDTLFQNYQAQTTGALLVGRAMVKLADIFNVSILDWSILVSAFSLVLFLTGVYALSFSTLRHRLLALTISLASIVPVISLGLSSWGFLALGFVPKELSLGIAVWLSLIYVKGVQSESPKVLALFFLLLGIASNWYSVLFFHYALVLLCAEVIRARAVKMRHVWYGVLFLAAAPLALYDIFIKAAGFSAPAIDIVIDHYTDTLHSVRYLLLHYLRKQIVYVATVGILWYGYRRLVGKPLPEVLRAWYGVWWASLMLSSVGVAIELWFPTYMKYLVSRISVWFYFSSMLLIASSAYEITATRIKTKGAVWMLAGGLLLFFLGQSSLAHMTHSFTRYVREAPVYRDYLAVTRQLTALVPPDMLVLANPDDEAKTLRAYGGVGTFVSAKDGNVTLFDGDAARFWHARYRKTQDVFATRNFAQLRAYALENNVHFYLYDLRDIGFGTTTLQKETLFTSGTYGLVRF